MSPSAVTVSQYQITGWTVVAGGSLVYAFCKLCLFRFEISLFLTFLIGCTRFLFFVQHDNTKQIKGTVHVSNDHALKLHIPQGVMTNPQNASGTFDSLFFRCCFKLRLQLSFPMKHVGQHLVKE